MTLGFCKICFCLISGLSSMAMVLSGPNNIDMLVSSIVLELLAPVLVFSIASGSEIQALSSISYSSQNLGLGTGLNNYIPMGALGSDPNQTKNISYKVANEI